MFEYLTWWLSYIRFIDHDAISPEWPENYIRGTSHLVADSDC